MSAKSFFAVARGAKGKAFLNLNGVKIGVNITNKTHIEIDDEDLYLLYGPVSDFIRQQAEDPPTFFPVINLDEGWFDASSDDWERYRGEPDDVVKSLYLLLLAEELADVGL